MDKNIIPNNLIKPPDALTLLKNNVDSSPYLGTITGVTDSIANEYNTYKTATENVQNQQAATGTDILGLMNEISGKTADTQAVENQTGVGKVTEEQNKYVQQLADLNAQASILNREAQAIPLQVQEQFKNTGATDRGVAPIETGKLRENAIRALSIAQQSDVAAAALTGSKVRLQAAKDKAQQIVDLKYKPLEEKLAIKERQYALNKDILDKYDKKRSEALGVVLEKEKADLAEKKAKEKAIQDMIVTATPNAPVSTIASAKAIADKGGSALEVAQVLGEYGGDYLKTELLKEQIKTEKAQRSNYLASAAKTRTETDLLKGEGGQYTEKQKKAITKLNEDVSKNATYAKTTAMRGYADNVSASLSQGTGTGDLAAINQFQKVIDEGAVTRDQDVKLIQQSQSLLDSIKTKANRLAKGEQLSPELRQQMRTSVEALYDAQIKALNKDPYIKAKTTEAGLYGLKDTDTILGELGGFTVGGTVNPADNKFGQSLGPVMSKIPGTTIINQVKPDGSLDFILPTNQPTR